MKTSKEYQINLRNKIITENMLYDCLFSLNKRAKNCRDKKNEYWRSEYKWDYIERMDEYYRQKDFLLKSILKPTLIHRQTTYNFYGNKNVLYFLFYEMPQGTFYLPVDEHYAKNGNHGLKIEKIQDDFYTHGKEIDGLLSVQFVKKVIDLVESKDYTYQVDTKQ